MLAQRDTFLGDADPVRHRYTSSCIRQRTTPQGLRWHLMGLFYWLRRVATDNRHLTENQRPLQTTVSTTPSITLLRSRIASE
ncbi:hypothetical protein IMCC3135_16655 [Granulosicoccus antarcticus IMCC3135]|uniref:Uncharacterized protein n=1 Tax=Granulosicoccus antarcticus IMCC3135 TaxID=1192854 RepID=A0A2Z2NQ34_9GAMM|nr:hypothetical protein IMCC3135_16655 [Granulosicoccus antarcticus IMCC3135]